MDKIPIEVWSKMTAAEKLLFIDLDDDKKKEFIKIKLSLKNLGD